MSIVPYYSDRNTRVVYHDLDHQIVVVHNHQDNSVSLYHDRLRYSQPRGPVSAGVETGKAEIFCPNCGVGLLDFLQGHRSSTRRRTSKKTSSRRKERPTGVFLSVSLFSDPVSIHDSVAIEDSVALLDSVALPRRTAIARWAPLPSTVGFSPVEFMHRDYFKLLAQVGNSAALGAPGDEQTTNADLFNQGYFERFFKKIHPVVLGSGARAQVYKVVHVLKNIQLGVFAVKRINVGDHSQYLDHVLNEALILYELSVRGANEHNLIRYNHVWMETGELADLSTILLGREGAPSRSSNAVVPYVYILQQYCDGGHLENMISRTFQREATMLCKERVEMERARRRRSKTLELLPPPPEKRWLRDVEVWKFFREIVNGVLYLHAHGILHRDLKPSNCLLESRYEPSAIGHAQRFASQRDLDAALARLPRVLVSDFGEGKFIDKSPSVPADDRCGNTGTVEFTDPKLWVYAAADRHTQVKRKFAHRFSYDSDIYSLGMILCYLCVGVLPFADILTNTNDPEAIRRDISVWHDALSAQSFQDWFSRRCVLVYGRSPASMGDFEILIFMMIKGDLDAPKPSADYVMDYLQLIRDRWFAAAPENSMDDVSSDGQPRDAGPNEETVDLLRACADDRKPAPPRLNRVDYRVYVHAGVSFVCHAILEAHDAAPFRKHVQCAKLANVIFFVIGLQYPHYCVLLLVSGVLATAAAMYVSQDASYALYMDP